MIIDGLSLPTYDGIASDTLRADAGAADLFVLDECVSTMDIAHARAADGALHGLVVVAEEQRAGRGRSGKTWVSARGRGVWTSILLRPAVAATPGVLSLRIGLELAERLERRSGKRLTLKWPNDVFHAGSKLAGILIEARWRGAVLEWIVVGVGVNILAAETDVMTSTGLGVECTRAAVLVDVVRAVLAATGRTGELDADEMARYAARDHARGRVVTAPHAGVVQGITSGGGVVIRTAGGDEVIVAGSLVFRDDAGEKAHAAGV